jgi:hypothetical protein
MGDPASDDFWADLLPLVRARQVVPVVGADLLWSGEGADAVPFYQTVAERLVAPMSKTAALPGEEWSPRPQSLMSDSVCALAAFKKRPVADCYLWVYQVLDALLKGQRASIEASHRDLAAVEDFRLFVSTTPDDVMARAIDSVRYGGAPETQQIEYAPSSLSKDHTTDLSPQWADDQSAVFYLFGKMAVSPTYAIHDEDTLEFIHGLQAGLGPVPKYFFSTIRNANLLLIGCKFPDWIGRFLMRLTAPQRLSEQRGRRDFIIDRNADQRSDFVVFVRQFAGSTQVLSMDPREFVRELLARWQASRAADGITVSTPANGPRPIARQQRAIFISYSRTDIDAARTLYAELTRIGGDDIAWFDKNDIKPGTLWRRSVEQAIESCQLFLPIVSRSAEKRDEAEFIAEWNAACDRWKRIRGKTFVVPVCIDPDANDTNIKDYRYAVEMFGKADFGFAPGGKLTKILETSLITQLRLLRA